MTNILYMIKSNWSAFTTIFYRFSWKCIVMSMQKTKNQNVLRNYFLKLYNFIYLNWQKISAYSLGTPTACSKVTLKVNSLLINRWPGSSSSLISDDTELSPWPLSPSASISKIIF